MIPLIPDITCNPGKEILLWLVPKNLLYFGKPACLVNRKGRLKQESTTYNWTPKKQTADFKMTKDVNISPKKIQVVNMHRKRCSISPTTMIHHRPVIRMVMREKKDKITSVGKDAEKLKPLCTVVCGAPAMGRSTEVLNTLKQNYHVMQQFYFWVCLQTIKSRYLYTHVHSSIMHKN